MQERIAWVGGDQPRHLYYVNEIAKNFDIVGGIMQERGEKHPEMSAGRPIPPTPQGLSFIDRVNWGVHFRTRFEKELQYFGKQPTPNIELIKVTKDTLNSDESVKFIKSIKPDIVLIFGSGMIREPLFSALPERKLNLHLGLSPRYRGAATCFWPFYFLEPNFAGATFHYIVDEPDAGKIIHQVVPTLEKGDGIHDVGAKTVLEATTEAVALLKLDHWDTHTQTSTGKNFLESDFKPEHLRVIYQVYNNDVVDAYLTGELKCKEPKLFRQKI